MQEVNGKLADDFRDRCSNEGEETVVDYTFGCAQ
jgi:hypothetical protein